MLDDEPSGPIPDQINPKVILVDDDPCEGDKTSAHSQFLGNPFPNPGDIVASPHGHNQAQSSSESREGVTMVIRGSATWFKPLMA